MEGRFQVSVPAFNFNGTDLTFEIEIEMHTRPHISFLPVGRRMNLFPSNGHKKKSLEVDGNGHVAYIKRLLQAKTMVT